MAPAVAVAVKPIVASTVVPVAVVAVVAAVAQVAPEALMVVYQSAFILPLLTPV